MKTILKAAGLLVAAALAFSVGFAGQDLRKGQMPGAETVSLLVPQKQSGPRATPTQVFKQAFKQIQTQYYRPVEANELKFAGMEGMLSALGDPHTQFLEPKTTEDFNKETKGQVDFVGVGARLLPDPLGAKVTSVFRGGPAATGGIKAGDLIIAVDGKSTEGIEIDDVVSKIRGVQGTKVTLTAIRSGEKKTFVMKRAKVVAPTADSFIIDGTDIGYLAVFSFAENTPEQFDQALRALRSEGAKGLVIDLRGNPGGLLQAAVEMLSRFVEDKLVVKMKFKGGKEQVESTEHGRLMDPIGPVVVLINEESASAAEIFSGVMRDYKLATLVGEHTYGKASVQNLFMLIDGSSAKVTIARYYLPSGQDVGRKVDDDGQYLSGGIMPDVEVELSLNPKTMMSDVKTDNQLQKAIEIIRQKQ